MDGKSLALDQRETWKKISERGKELLIYRSSVFYFIPEVQRFQHAIFLRSFVVHAVGQMSFATRDSVLKNTHFKGLQYGQGGRLGIPKNKKQKTQAKKKRESGREREKRNRRNPTEKERERKKYIRTRVTDACNTFPWGWYTRRKQFSSNERPMLLQRQMMFEKVRPGPAARNFRPEERAKWERDKARRWL